MLKEAEIYYAKGVKALHWLHPKSKRPVEKGWTTKPPAGWDALRAKYKDGMNLGVRLGGANPFPDFRFLAALDVDIKSSEPQHRSQALDAVAEILGCRPRDARTWVALSGRGGGSCHIYIRTKAPVKPRLLKRSKDLVAVMMPSVKPGARDKEHISSADIEKGMRLRPAWEVSLMGEGQQIVLPPSIHPDSGRCYRWAPMKSPSDVDLPMVFEVIEPADEEGAADAVISIADWEPVKVNILDGRLRDDVVNMIVSGVGVSDRSAAIMSVSLSMKRAGFSDEEILTVLTDRKWFLGAVAFDHTGSGSRKKAAEWVAKFTLKKATSEMKGGSDLGVIEEGEGMPDGSGFADDNEAVLDDGDWTNRIERAKSGVPLKTYMNAKLILKNLIGEDGLKHNEFTLDDSWLKDMPWKSKAGESVSDRDILRIKDFLATKYRLELNVNLVSEVVMSLADEKSFHPVKDYLEGLKWDGVERVDGWLKHYLGATASDDRYLEMAGRKTLTAMVARIYEPGCAFHHILVFQGEGRRGKSETWKILAGPDWFSDGEINMSDQFHGQALLGKWVIEIAEMAMLRKVGVNSMKNFISSDTDEFRRPYGRKREKRKRSFIFGGTTNDESFLRDATGNARFWPVSVDRLKYDDLIRDRDQLLAEAKVIYEAALEPLNYHPEWFMDLAAEEAAARDEFQELDEEIHSVLDSDEFAETDQIRTIDIYASMGKVPGVKSERVILLRIGQMLRKRGWMKKKVRVGRKTFKAWVKIRNR